MLDTLQLMGQGFISALSFANILAMAGGVALGIIIGCLPGLSAAMGVALMLPLTFSMPADTGLIVLGAIYCGAIFGGSISAILIHTPGTPASAATATEAKGSNCGAEVKISKLVMVSPHPICIYVSFHGTFTLYVFLICSRIKVSIPITISLIT